MRKPAFIALLCRRQYDPEVQAVIWRSREVDLIATPHLNTPQTRRGCLHTSTIKAHLPPCSLDAPEDPACVQPPEA